MALINKLRDKMGKVVAFAIGFAILSFVLADLLGPTSFITGAGDRNVGEIAGNTITIDEYQSEIDVLIANYNLNFGRNPSEQELTTLREQAWELLIVKYAFQEEYDDLGLEVNDDEVVDMVQGKNVSPAIQQAFVNPETGTFDKQQLLAYLQQIDQAPAQQQMAWYMFEKDLKPSRLRLKYENLLRKSTYVTTEQAKRNYENQTAVAEAKYLYVPYYSINDSLVSITDSELEAYLKENEDQYQSQESRSFQYVKIPIIPSAEDTAYFKDEILELGEQIATVSDDSTFAVINSDGQTPYMEYRANNLPVNLQENIAELEGGKVMGPYQEGASFTMYKISEMGEDERYMAKVSHILFKWDENDDASKPATLREARDVLKQIQDGGDFEALARTHSKDNSASRGGDLGWGTKGETWVEDFENPVFRRSEAGLINNIVETEFGYHIIKVTEPPSNKYYKVATIVKEIAPSDETIEVAFRKAGLFQASIDNYDDFVSAAQRDSLRVLTASNVGSNQRSVPGLINSRGIVQWLYNTAKVGSISDVFELDDTYVVAVMTAQTEEGISDLDDVRPQVSLKVRNQKKAELIKSKLNELSGSLEEISEAYGNEAVVHTSSDLKMNTNFLPSVGLAPEAIGHIFTMEAGERSQPLNTENGVVLVELISTTPAPEIADYTTYKTQIKDGLISRISFGLSETIKKYADISDERYKAY